MRHATAALVRGCNVVSWLISDDQQHTADSKPAAAAAASLVSLHSVYTLHCDGLIERHQGDKQASARAASRALFTAHDLN